MRAHWPPGVTSGSLWGSSPTGAADPTPPGPATGDPEPRMLQVPPPGAAQSGLLVTPSGTRDSSAHPDTRTQTDGHTDTDTHTADGGGGWVRGCRSPRCAASHPQEKPGRNPLRGPLISPHHPSPPPGSSPSELSHEGVQDAAGGAGGPPGAGGGRGVPRVMSPAATPQPSQESCRGAGSQHTTPMLQWGAGR